MSQDPAPSTKRRWTRDSIFLLLIGLLIIVTSGLFTASLTMFMETLIPGAASVLLPFGALGVAVGGLFIYGGLKERRHPSAAVKLAHRHSPLGRDEPVRQPTVDKGELVLGLMLLGAPVFYTMWNPSLVFGMVQYTRFGWTMALWLPFVLLVLAATALGAWLVYSAVKPPRRD